MSAQRQSSLLKFFGTPGRKLDEENADSPSTPKARSKKPEVFTPKEARSLKKRQRDVDEEEDQKEDELRRTKPKRRVLVSSDDEDFEENEQGSKKGDEENITPPKTSTALMTPKTKKAFGCLSVRPQLTPSTPKTKFGEDSAMTPMSTPGLAKSFIDSFRKDESDNEMDTTIASMCTLDKTIYMADGERSTKKKKKNDEDDLPEIDGAMVYDHEKFDFLKRENLRDERRRLSSDPDYDPTTLFLPPDFLREQTPGHSQWWTIKAKNFDTVLLFKVGKFYELYHMDAVIAVNHLSLTYMRGKFAHAGFPESAYGRFADQLVSRGFKVARIEQTETPEQLENRTKVAKKKEKSDKVVRRELCRVTTSGTKTYGPIDSIDGGMTGEATAKPLIAIKQISNGNVYTYGVCMIDTAVGQFTVAHFIDDEYHSSLRTLIASFQPVQVLIERNSMSATTRAIIDSMLSSVPCEQLLPKSQFLTAEATVKLLCGVNYLGSDASTWPPTLRQYLDSNSTIPQPTNGSSALWSALGAVIWFLQRCLIDVDMLTMGRFEEYDPRLELKNELMSVPGEEKWRGRHMVLDSVTLENLNLLPSGGNARDSTSAAYSLLNVVNRCATSFGRRLLHEWVCKPTCDPETIRKRQDAIEWLHGAFGNEFAEKANAELKAIPDLARLLQKIHTLGLKYRAEEHPDARAVMFEGPKYNRRKIKDLLVTLRGFETTRRLVDVYDECRMEGESVALLDTLIGVEHVPDITEDLKHFKVAFNHEKAEKDGIIVPKPGLDQEYDAAVENVGEMEKQLEKYRRKQEKDNDCKVTYIGTGRNRYQMEFPEKMKMSHRYELSSKRKGFARYYTEDLREMIDQLGKAEEERDRLQADSTRRVFADFDTRASKWDSVVKRIAVVDVLISLAKFARTCGLKICRPVFDFDATEAYLSVEAGVHPCLATKGLISTGNAAQPSTYIPNDTNLGGSHPSCMLLTGPNMGGKSTLMRQTAVLAVLAHMGSFVPAESMRLTPVDRIFTRIGANDRIVAGQSTFFVELQETRLVLKSATSHSLVLIDELGRGTSTYDGTAIASAVLAELADQLRCRTLFSTHYHTLCTRVADNPRVLMAHMACMVEGENEEDPTMETVTFLYRLVAGICPKSYGFYAAKLAGIRDEVVRNAYTASQRLSSCTGAASQIETLREMATRGDFELLTQMIQAL
ncbi:unnamed protein product, partial [Mesorhabditis belari]|uniref:DNA mismatch repair protein n=1 Tax=Mesorhabditis belari TaxID=2138241 RepID=A0AAF3F0U0_9BILA